MILLIMLKGTITTLIVTMTNFTEFVISLLNVAHFQHPIKKIKETSADYGNPNKLIDIECWRWFSLVSKINKTIALMVNKSQLQMLPIHKPLNWKTKQHNKEARI
jgi:hypothetical protein